MSDAERKPRRVDAFQRDAGESFMDPKKETFAKACAKTGMLKTACEEADISLPTGAKWRGNAEMVERIRELRAGAETFVGVSKAWIVNRFRENAENAAAMGKIKESNEALDSLYKIVSTDPDLKSGEDAAAGGMSADMTPVQLAAYRAALFPAPTLVADTRELVQEPDGLWAEPAAVFDPDAEPETGDDP